MFETESAENVIIETPKKPLIICGFLGVFWNICSGVSQPVKAPTKDKMPPAVQKEPFCDRNTCTSAAAPEAEKKVLLENFQHLVVQGSKGASRKIHYGTEDHLGSTRMVLKAQNNGSSTIEQALMYQPYGTVSDVEGITAPNTDPLRQKFTTKEFDEEGPDFAKVEFNIALDFALTHNDPTKPNRVEVYYTDAPSNPEIIYVTIDPANKGEVSTTLNYTTSRTIASIQFKLNDDAVTCNVENIAEITNSGSKLTITKTASTIADFLPTVPKTFLNYSNESFYMAGIGAYHFGARMYDPDIGIWISTDPKDQYWNTYSYCGYNPINSIDATGRGAEAAVDLGTVFIHGLKIGFTAAQVATLTAALASISMMYLIYETVKPVELGDATLTGNQNSHEFFSENTQEGQTGQNGDVDEQVKPGENVEPNPEKQPYAPDRDLPRDENGNPIPDSDDAHTQLGQKTGRTERYPQSREWGPKGERGEHPGREIPKKDIDWTDHGRPQNHTNPHEHPYDPQTGKRL